MGCLSYCVALRSATLLLLLAQAAATTPGEPVIIIPGDGGCQLEARLVGKPKVKHWWCYKDSSWFRLWLDVKQLLPGQVDCWADNMRQVYHPATVTTEAHYSNSPGVEVRVPGWGDTRSVEYLDPVIRGGGSVMFAALVEHLAAAGGVRNASIRAAPYDFRRIPDGEYIQQLRVLVENTAAMNAGAPVALVSHSMGCLVASRFLAAMTEEWKATHVARWAGVSCAFGGSESMVRLFASGNNLGVSAVKPSAIREEQRSSEANFWLLPSPHVFRDAVLVSTPDRNYTADDYEKFFADVGFPEGWEQYQRVRETTGRLWEELPGVPFVHFYGTEVDTPALHSWPRGEFKKQPRVTAYASGDGTLNIRSLSAVEAAWGGQGPPGRYEAKEYPGETHTGILQNKQFLADLLATLGWVSEPIQKHAGSGKPDSFLRRVRTV